MAQGRRVIDIGPAAGRLGFPGPTSDAYSLELQLLEEAAYGNVMLHYDLPIAIEAR